ncbi:MAG TPA: GGDEF domain-containing protein [Xanthomonadales bacterium]|nr:GGDEF domain-containing protein [Xanthomonadales bacterium]
MSNGTEAGPRSRAEFRLEREVADTHQRSLIGGVFYLVGWLLVGGYAGAFARDPAMAGLVAAVFALLAAARVLVKPPGDPARGQPWLAWNWAVVLATALTWGAVSVWVHADTGFEAVHHAALVCTVAFATAIVHTFAMRPVVALAALALLFAPTVVAYWQAPDERSVAIALSIYVLYLLLALARSAREYRARLELDWQLREQRDAYERLSRADPLTGIANRRSFQDELARAAGEARTSGEPLALLMLDLDHFKHVNDRHGHVFGDDCLVGFTRELERAFGDGFAARLGGEEFAVLLRGALVAARERAERFRSELAARPLVLPEREVAMTVSIGIGQYDAARAQNLDEFVRNVDRALYRAKAEGRDRVCDAEPLSR